MRDHGRPAGTSGPPRGLRHDRVHACRGANRENRGRWAAISTSTPKASSTNSQGGTGFEGATIGSATPPARRQRKTWSKRKSTADSTSTRSPTTSTSTTSSTTWSSTRRARRSNGSAKKRNSAPIPGLKKGLGLAVDPVTGKVYVADANATPPSVAIFAPHPPLPPVVSTGWSNRSAPPTRWSAPRSTPAGGHQYAVEFGLTDKYGSTGHPSPDRPIAGRKGQAVTINLEGLTPGTEYHYRVVAENSTTTTHGPDETLVTYAPTPGVDESPNQLVRKQTGASGLADCRAYELASASSTGGYNVASDLVPGQSPLPGFPSATGPSKLLYTLASGSIPGSETRPRSPTTHTSPPAAKTVGRRDTSASRLTGRNRRRPSPRNSPPRTTG